MANRRWAWWNTAPKEPVVPHEFVSRLVKDVPALAALRVRTDRRSGVVSPVVFFDRLALWAEDQPLDSRKLRTVLDRCESAYTDENALLCHVIQVGLIAGMAYNSPVYDLMGPRMTRDVQPYMLKDRGVAGLRTSPDSFVREVVAEVPPLQPLLADHLADRGGDVEAFSFFPQVARWADAQPASSKDLLQLLNLCERAYSGLDDRLRKVLHLSFLESLRPRSHVFELLGPALSAEAARLPRPPGWPLRPEDRMNGRATDG